MTTPWAARQRRARPSLVVAATECRDLGATLAQPQAGRRHTHRRIRLAPARYRALATSDSLMLLGTGNRPHYVMIERRLVRGHRMAARGVIELASATGIHYPSLAQSTLLTAFDSRVLRSTDTSMR